MGVTRAAAAERRELVRRLVSERESTGESWRAIAARTGINHATLTGWVWRLSREGALHPRRDADRPQFIELVATEPSRSKTELELALCGDRRVRIGAGFDAATLVRLVQALESC